MQAISSAVERPIPTASIPQQTEAVTLRGMVHALRNLGSVCFVVLRRADGIVQCVLPEGMEPPGAGDAVELRGSARPAARAPGGCEVGVAARRVITRAHAPMPVPIHKAKMNLSLETELSLRPITLRNLRIRAGMKLQEGLVRGFRDALSDQGFTEVHTPKLGAQSAEGGANVFKLPYFGQRACLAQSPQLYKQMMAGVYDRVFEVGPVFRAEKHNTVRHLSEYTSLDLEMAFIDGFEDIMAMEVYVIRRMMEVLASDYAPQLKALGVALPTVETIPALRFDEAKARVAESYGHATRDPHDLTPEEEQLISRYAKEQWDSDFVFVTHYPSAKRPFYAMDDPEDPRHTLSFDLLFRGLEVTTGGQRIHDYAMQMEKLERRGMETEGLESYLLIHKHGIPPHGGLGMGLERMLKQILGEPNIRQACLFPRDTVRLTP